MCHPLNQQAAFDRSWISSGLTADTSTTPLSRWVALEHSAGLTPDLVAFASRKRSERRLAQAPLLTLHERAIEGLTLMAR